MEVSVVKALQVILMCTKFENQCSKLFYIAKSCITADNYV